MIEPLTEKQMEKLPKNINAEANAVRFMTNGQAIDICTGYLYPKGINVIHQIMYWHRPKEFINTVVEFLSENNPEIKIVAKK